uniref:hypothetical protein n=1 Tax=Klebsiella pneumoniae TaxID=573 RepID=UPI00163D7536
KTLGFEGFELVLIDIEGECDGAYGEAIVVVIGSLGVGVFNGFVKLIMENCYCLISLRDIDEIFTTLESGCMVTTFLIVFGWIG